MPPKLNKTKIMEWREELTDIAQERTLLITGIPAKEDTLRSCTYHRNHVEGQIIELNAILLENGYANQEDLGPVDAEMQVRLNRFAILERRRNRWDRLNRATGWELKEAQWRIMEIDERTTELQGLIDTSLEAERVKAAALEAQTEKEQNAAHTENTDAEVAVVESA